MYTADIEKVTCDCPDFKFRRSRMAKGSAERRCKHLREAMVDIPIVASKTWSEKKRHPRALADRMVKIVTNSLLESKTVETFEFVGSYRRGQSTIGDIDVIIVKKDDIWDDNVDILERLRAIAEKVMVSGPQKTSLVLGGVQVDLRFVKKEHFVFQLHHATGSKEHNVMLRAHAKRKGMQLSEYGLLRGKDLIQGIETEEDIYKHLELQYVPPTKR